MTGSIKTIFIFFLVVVSINFFEAQFLDEKTFTYLQFFYMAIAIILSLPYFFHRRTGFVFPVQLMVVSILFSMVMAYVSWGQDFPDSLKATVPLLTWIFFFYLLEKRVEIDILEKIILIYGFIYVALYFYQVLNSDVVLFGWGDELEVDRGVLRIVFPGGGVFILASFIALNKMSSKSSHRFVWFLMALAGPVVTFLQATRQFIFAVFFLYLFHLLKESRLYKKIVIVAGFVIFIIIMLRSENLIFTGLAEAQKMTVQQGRDYIRFVSGYYFLSEFSPNTASRIFGNGLPYGEKSSYGIFVENLKDRGIYMTDVGLIGMYALYGIFSVLAFILIWIKSFKISLPKEYYYLKYYLWFLLITSLTSSAVFFPYFLISTVFVLYIYQSILENQICETEVDPDGLE